MKVLFYEDCYNVDSHLVVLMKKTKGKEKLKEKDYGNCFVEEKEMMKNCKTTLKRQKKRNNCAGSNECEYEDKKEKCEKNESRVKNKCKE